MDFCCERSIKATQYMVLKVLSIFKNESIFRVVGISWEMAIWLLPLIFFLFSFMETSDESLDVGARSFSW
jgi:hypothetical protein